NEHRLTPGSERRPEVAGCPQLAHVAESAVRFHAINQLHHASLLLHEQRVVTHEPQRWKRPGAQQAKAMVTVRHDLVRLDQWRADRLLISAEMRKGVQPQRNGS